MTTRYPLLGLQRGMVLVMGRLFGPERIVDLAMILDTGSSVTVVAPEVFADAGIDTVGAAVGQRIAYTYTDVERISVVTVPRLRVFGQEIENLEVACGRLPSQLKVRGVVGLNFLRHFDLRLNFREEYIELR